MNHEHQTGIISKLSVIRFNRTASQPLYVCQSLKKLEHVTSKSQKNILSAYFKFKFKNHFCSQSISLFKNYIISHIYPLFILIFC